MTNESTRNDAPRRRGLRQSSNGGCEARNDTSRLTKTSASRWILGEPIPPECVYVDVPRPPNWARWQREGLDRRTEIIHWWIDATARSERGKPAGVIPAAIQWPSGEPAGRSDW